MKKCPYPVQLSFIIDSSSFVPEEIENQKLIIRSIASKFHLSNDTPLSVLYYSKDSVKVENTSSYQELLKVTEKIPHVAGKRMLLSAIQTVASNALKSSNVSRVTQKTLMIITDGGTIPAHGESWNVYRDTAQLIQKAGVRVIVVGLRTRGSSKMKLFLQSPSDMLLSSWGLAKLDMEKMKDSICTGSGG